jgi:hypothetical protein
MSTTELIAAIALVAILAVGLATVIFLRRRRTGRLRGQFGAAEYAHAVGQGRRHGEADLAKRGARVESFDLQPLTPTDQTRYEGSWRSVQARFVDSPASAVVEADQLLRDVMSTRGYPVSDFEQGAADISVDHPMVMKNYRTAHEIAFRQTKGQASTEDLRQAMIHYRTLFGELVGEERPPDVALTGQPEMAAVR